MSKHADQGPLHYQSLRHDALGKRLILGELFFYRNPIDYIIASRVLDPNTHIYFATKGQFQPISAGARGPTRYCRRAYYGGCEWRPGPVSVLATIEHIYSSNNGEAGIAKQMRVLSKDQGHSFEESR